MQEKIKFVKHHRQSSFVNPMLGNVLDTQELEIRVDPLTGFQSVFNPRLEDKVAAFTPPSDQALIEKIARQTEATCFLCQDRWKRLTPTYAEGFVPGGRILIGEAVLFPNLFPVSEVHAVVRVGEKHYLGLKEFVPIRIVEALQASRDLTTRLRRASSGAEYLTISGNYLGPAGAGFVHPHFQVLGGDLPFPWTEVVFENSRRYFRKNGSCYWSDLIRQERAGGERFAGDFGPLSLITSYAPLGTNEVVGILGERRSFLELTDEDLQGLAEGLSCALAAYGAMGISTFNFSLYSGPLSQADDACRCFFRLVSRQNVYENYRTDDSFLQKLLCYQLILMPPEALAAILRKANG